MTEFLIIAIMYLYPCDQVSAYLEQSNAQQVSDVFEGEIGELINQQCFGGAK